MTSATLLSLMLGAIAIVAQSDITAVVSKASSSVVLIKGSSINGGTLLGSGFIVSSDGKIATNLHVVRDLKSGAVRLPTGEVYDNFSVVAFDERKDLAVIRIAGFELPSLGMGNSNELKPGETVIAIGNPDALNGTVTKGIVSAIRDDPAGRGFRVIQTDAAINPGNSGGPLLNEKGEVVGIVSAKIKDSENLNFAVPINYLRGLLDSPLAPLTLDEMRSKLGNLQDTAIDQPQRSRGVLLAGYGSPADSFQTVFIELMNYLSTNVAAVANAPGAFRPAQGDEISVAYLIERVSKVGADSMLYLTLEHGYSNVHRAKLQSFDASGNLLWEERASSTWTWATSETGAARAVAEQLKKKMRPHIGKPGLQLRPAN